jgi:SpoVK/Ycf46/Vps4 family AAA+-type ATPase
MAARALATALRRPLYRIDLASVVSKWVGETEKNLRDALGAAEASGAILLFDEGDALFGKRGEVAKGSDRYANLEVSYLLQALEVFEGIVIVTTNLRNNVDQAFARRFDTIIEFAAPNHEQRLRIWRQELGDACDPVLERDLRHLAKAAEILGGNIAAATRLALANAQARGAERLNAADLHLAIESEFNKLGSAVQASSWRRSNENGRA